MNVASEIYANACACFERQIREVAERELGCSMERGLMSGRLTAVGGQPYVDGRQICFLQPPKLHGMAIVWVFVDLTGEVKP